MVSCQHPPPSNSAIIQFIITAIMVVVCWGGGGSILSIVGNVHTNPSFLFPNKKRAAIMTVPGLLTVFTTQNNPQERENLVEIFQKILSFGGDYKRNCVAVAVIIDHGRRGVMDTIPESEFGNVQYYLRSMWVSVCWSVVLDDIQNLG